MVSCCKLVNIERGRNPSFYSLRFWNFCYNR
nr:MAG TPA: Transcription factor subunit Med10 of Mediator complex [Caudoviricetes sp.]